MLRPLGPGAHRRLQHSLQPSHTIPSTPSQKLGPSGGAAQVPTVEPLAITHSDVQQSRSRAQMSPGWIHQETASSHFPSTHDLEQHSPSPEQSLPAVLQLSFRGVQVSSGPQVPPQHSLSLEQSSPSETQAALRQTFPLQFKLQQSVGALQPAPGSPQATIADSQESVFGLQVPEQHSSPPEQSSPNALQVGPPSFPPSAVVPPKLEPDSPARPPVDEPPVDEPPVVEPPVDEPPVDEPPLVDPPTDIWPASPDVPPLAESPPDAELPLPPEFVPPVPLPAEPPLALPPEEEPAFPAVAPLPPLRADSFPPHAAMTAMVRDTRAKIGRTFIGNLGWGQWLRTTDRHP
jgi:hypothetical protein